MISPGWLVSFAIIHKDPRHWTYAKAAAARGVPIVIDSGAFSVASTGVVVTQFGYTNWLRRTGAWRTAQWVAALDVIGDPATTYRNWLSMYRSGITNVVPAVHYGADPDWVSRYADSGSKWLAIGGLVGRPRAQSGASDQEIRDWLDPVMDRARSHGVKVHGFGVNARWMISRYGLDSVDSTTFSSGTRFGKVPIYQGTTVREVKLPKLNPSQLQALAGAGVNVRALINTFTVTNTYPQNFAMLHSGLLAVLSSLDEWHQGDGVAYFSDWTNKHAQFILDLLARWNAHPQEYASTLARYRAAITEDHDHGSQ